MGRGTAHRPPRPQERRDRCGLAVDYRAALVVVTDPAATTRFYHVPCWDVFALAGMPLPPGTAVALREIADDMERDLYDPALIDRVRAIAATLDGGGTGEERQ